jgi:hypothetical protein
LYKTWKAKEIYTATKQRILKPISSQFCSVDVTLGSAQMLKKNLQNLLAGNISNERLWPVAKERPIIQQIKGRKRQ